jgi:tetratricopeptide (TPR) repeat protein
MTQKNSDAIKELVGSLAPKREKDEVIQAAVAEKAAGVAEKAAPQKTTRKTGATEPPKVQAKKLDVDDLLGGLKPKKKQPPKKEAPALEPEVAAKPQVAEPTPKPALESAKKKEKQDKAETAAEIGESFEDALVEGAISVVRDRVQMAVEAAVIEAIESAKTSVDEIVVDAIEDAKEEAKAELVSSQQERAGGPASRVARPHAFVVMPFGKKQGFDGTVLDFNAIYQDLIKPALEEAGFEPFRADEATTTGDILTDMFQELLLADLAICDLSIDNANVYYELGIRHAFRKRGVVHIQSGRAYMPFDIFNVRTIPYHTNDGGVPDPEFLHQDIQAIARVCRDTWTQDQDAIHSPVFNLLTGLDEPDRKALRTPLATGFWREYNEWNQRVTVAQRQKRIGDIMLLTEEISNPLIKEEAIAKAGKALKDMRRHELALQQYRQGLELNASNSEFRVEEAIHLNRLGRVDEAIVKLEDLLADEPGNTEAIATLGRIYKDMWNDSWETIEDETRRIQEAFDVNHWLVKSIHTYLKGYYADLNRYYPGINALTLSIILDHLAQQFEDDDDPDVKRIQEIMPDLKGTLEFSLENMVQDEAADYWILISLAELYVMTAEDPKRIKRGYKKALTAARKNVFNLQSSIQQLEMLKSLNLRPEYVDIGLEVLETEISRIQKDRAEEEEIEEKKAHKEPNVFLFAGHTVDTGSRVEKRFPPEMEEEVRKKIDAALDKYAAGEGDLAFVAGASCGGEVIFIEACLDRSMEVEIHLPFPEPKYIKDNISTAGDQWVDRFYNLRNNPLVRIRQQLDHVGKVKPGDDPYKRNNLWALYSSLLHGIDRVRLIALWDGLSTPAYEGDKMIVSHMVEEMRHMGGKVEHINTTKFDYWQAGGKVGKALDKLAGL